MPPAKGWSRKPLGVRELLKRLREFGVNSIPRRGKGSETILVRPDKPGSLKGPQYVIKDHGPGTEIDVPVINAILRQFGIDEAEFWSL